uniref:Uncharacterized protein n=1 Tax=Arundo donax TaxID=35708 RepID=A0A0A9AFM9_ARUDO
MSSDNLYTALLKKNAMQLQIPENSKEASNFIVT